MLALKIIGLIVCLIVACMAIKKIVESVLNLISLSHNKQTHHNVERTGMVYNKNSHKLEADNRKTVPFE